jgi:hypothetical protein
VAIRHGFCMADDVFIGHHTFGVWLENSICWLLNKRIFWLFLVVYIGSHIDGSSKQRAICDGSVGVIRNSTIVLTFPPALPAVAREAQAVLGHICTFSALDIYINTAIMLI